MKERLHKVMAQAGVASRRASEELIRQGRVTVNGAVATEMGVLVDPAHDRIAVDGRPLPSPATCSYILLHKPPGVLSTVRDTRGRPTVLDLIQPALSGAEGPPARLYPVGRLDLESEGLLLLTDDGALAYRLMHPRYQVEKEYHAFIQGRPAAATLQRWREGRVFVDERPAPARVEVLRHRGSDTWLQVILHEGRKRQVRRTAEALGHPVLRLVRVRLDGLTLGDLPAGRWRNLTAPEVTALQRAVGL